MLPADEPGISAAAAILQSGGTVVFPTETVWGLGACAYDRGAVQAIFTAKGRPADNPLIVHVDSLDAVLSVAREMPEVARFLFQAFSPGPLTIVLPARPELAPEVCAGLDSVGVRIPAHPVALSLLKAAGVPVAAPSANRSGRPSPTNASMAALELSGRVDAIIEGSSSGLGLESTVVAFSHDGRQLQILRPGSIGKAELQARLDAAGYEVVVHGAGIHVESVHRSPGTRHRHYSPQAQVLTLSQQAWEDQLAVIAGAGLLAGNRVGLVLPQALLELVSNSLHRAGISFCCIASFTDMYDYARLLYSSLRACDEQACTVALYYLPDGDSSIEHALRDRILRAAGKQ